MSSTASLSLSPDQVAALNGLVRETKAFGIDVAEDTYRSLRVITFAASPDGDDEDTTPVVRFFSISIAGSIRESSLLDSEAAA